MPYGSGGATAPEAAVGTLSLHLAAALEGRMMEEMRGLQLRVGDKALR
jgi:hypothetical protein